MRWSAWGSFGVLAIESVCISTSSPGDLPSIEITLFFSRPCNPQALVDTKTLFSPFQTIRRVLIVF